jgi:hypothetical protein
MDQYYLNDTELAEVMSLEAKDIKTSTGHLYEVEIPDEITDRMLDWDKPLSEQPESVRKALMDLDLADAESFFTVEGAKPLSDVSGQEAYDLITTAFREKGIGAGVDATKATEGASKVLNEAGIPGIRYKSGQLSGGKGDTSNIVVFNPDDITQVKRDGEEVYNALVKGKQGGDVDLSFQGKRTQRLETDMMGAVEEAKLAGDRLASVNERLKFAERIQNATPDELRRTELELRRRIKELTTSAKTNPTSAEPLRQANLMLEALKNPDVSGLTKQSDEARKVFDEASVAMRRSSELRNKNALVKGGEAARMKQATEQGYNIERPWYHGTTHTVEELRPDISNPENHLGRGVYLSDNPRDIEINYAGEGPDLTNRIQNRAERLADEMGLDYDDPKVLAKAKEELHGGSPQTIKVVTKDNDILQDTDYISFERNSIYDSIDDAKKDPSLKGLDGDDLDDAAEELYYESLYESEPEGPLADVLESLRRQSYEYDDMDFGKISEDLPLYEFDESGINAGELVDILKNNEGLMYATGDNGELMSSEIIRQALEDAGFKGYEHSADVFKNMDIPPGTRHRIMFEGTGIRSPNALFDPKKAGSKNLLPYTHISFGADPLVLPGWSIASLKPYRVVQQPPLQSLVRRESRRGQRPAPVQSRVCMLRPSNLRPADRTTCTSFQGVSGITWTLQGLRR